MIHNKKNNESKMLQCQKDLIFWLMFLAYTVISMLGACSFVVSNEWIFVFIWVAGCSALITIFEHWIRE